MQHTELRRTGKFLLFSCSAGLIELGSFALFNEVFRWPYWGAYLTALVLSVLWNFTCNRRYTFRSTEKVTRAMTLVFLYYCAFTPLSTLLEHRLADVQGWNGYLVTFLNMVLNFVTEFLYQRFVVYRKSLDTNNIFCLSLLRKCFIIRLRISFLVLFPGACGDSTASRISFSNDRLLERRSYTETINENSSFGSEIRNSKTSSLSASERLST